jgi:hypothetical protein
MNNYVGKIKEIGNPVTGKFPVIYYKNREFWNF